MKRILILGALICTLNIASCSQKNEPCLVQQEEVKSALKNESIVLLDVRTPKEFGEGHLKSALNIDIYNSNFADKIKELDKEKAYYVYCRSGRRSANAQEYMLSQGFKSVCNVKGGILLLKEQGVNLVVE